MDPLSALEAETEEQTARREIEVDASPDEVWEALTTEDGRERWLDGEPEREIHVETADEPSRLVWWWWHGDEPATRVEFVVAPAPGGTRVVVTETLPRFAPVARFPIAAFAGSPALAVA